MTNVRAEYIKRFAQAYVAFVIVANDVTPRAKTDKTADLRMQVLAARNADRAVHQAPEGCAGYAGSTRLFTATHDDAARRLQEDGEET